MQKAHAFWKAEQRGDKYEIAATRADRDAYRDLCLKAEKMNLGTPCDAL